MKTLMNKKFLCGLLAALMLLGILVNLISPVLAEEEKTSGEIKKQLEQIEADQARLEAEIRELESKLRDNLTEMEAMVAQKGIIDNQIFSLQAQVANINEMISSYNVLIADKQEELIKAEERLAQLNAQNKERIRAMEEDGALSYWAVLFKANSFSDLLDRINMIEEIAAADRRRLDEMREAADLVAATQAELQVEKANLEQVKEQLAVKEAELLEKRIQTDALLTQLIATGEEYEKYMEEGEEAQQELANQHAQKQQEYEDAKESEYWAEYWATYTEPPTTEPPYQPPVGGGGAVNDGGWRIPMNVVTWITSPYGWRWHPVHGGYRFHHGVDLAGDYGDDIVAARDGVVTVASYQEGGAGYYVTINHGDGFSSIYMHMTHYTVKVGDTVVAGQKIGECGSTGASTGPHLHFGIYYYGESVNPADYVDF